MKPTEILIINSQDSEMDAKMSREGIPDSEQRIRQIPKVSELFDAHNIHIHQQNTVSQGLPSLDDTFDLIMIMGTLSIIPDQLIVDMQKFIQEVISQQRAVIGICLGSLLTTLAISGKISDHAPQSGITQVFPTEIGKRTLFAKIKNTEQINMPCIYKHATTQAPQNSQILGYDPARLPIAYSIGENAVFMGFHPDFSISQIRIAMKKVQEGLLSSTEIQRDISQINELTQEQTDIVEFNRHIVLQNALKVCLKL